MKTSSPGDDGNLALDNLARPLSGFCARYNGCRRFILLDKLGSL